MFSASRRQIWTQQPQGAVGLSDDVAEYSPVFATVLGSDNRNIVNGQSPSGLVNVKGVGAAGIGLQGDTTASGGRAAYAVQTRGQQLTVVVTVTPGSYVTSYPMLLETDVASVSYSEGSFFLLPYYRYSGEQPNYWSLAVNPSEGGNTGYAMALIPAPVAGKPHTLVIRMDRALGGFAVIRDVHIDGVKQSISIDDGVPLLEAIPAGSHWNSNNLHINSRSGNSLYGNHLVHAAALFAANPPESVARQWSENPWQIFKRPDSRIFVPVSVGGGPTNITGTLSNTLDSITTVIQGSLGYSGSLNINLDTITVTWDGVLNHIGTGTLILEDVVVTFSGAVDTAGSVSGTLTCTLDNIVFNSAGHLNHSTTLSITLDDVFVSLAGTVAGTPENIDGTLSIVLDGIGFISSGNSGTITLTEDDINAIMDAILNNPKTLTVPKFLGLK